jgi:hypothetical protein
MAKKRYPVSLDSTRKLQAHHIKAALIVGVGTTAVSK